MATKREIAANKAMNTQNIHHVNTTNAMNYHIQQQRYYQQRKDALADRNYADRYNSPEQQMQRFKEAGLNPHLIYGQAGSTTSASVKGSSFDSPGLQAPDVKQHLPYTTDAQMMSDIGNTLGAISDNTARMAQVDNVNAQTDLTKAREMNENQELQSKTFDLTEKQALKDVNREIAAERLRNAKLDNAIKEGEPGRRESDAEVRRQKLALDKGKLLLEGKKYELSKAKSPHEIAKIIASTAKDNQYISQSKQAVRNMQSKEAIMSIEKAIKREELELRKHGLNPNSSSGFDRILNMGTKALYDYGRQFDDGSY